MKHPRLRAVLASLVLLSSCSPYPYAPAVKTFAGGVSRVGEALSANDTTAAATNAAFGRFTRRDQAVHAPMALTVACFKEASDDAPCERVTAQTQSQGAAPAKSTAGGTVTLTAPASGEFQCPAVAGMGPPPGPADLAKVSVTAGSLSSALQGYADGLTAITNAADRAALDSAIADLSKSAGALAGTIGMAAGPAASAAGGTAISAGLSLAGWIVGTALDQRRFDALDDTVRVTCAPVQVLAEAADTLIDARLIQIADDRRASAITILKGMRPGMSREEFYRRDQEVDDLLAAGIQPPVTGKHLGASFRKAHDALVRAVINREGQTQQLIDAVGKFADLAKALDASATKTKAK